VSDQVTVDLDCMEMVNALDQRAGQRAKPGADFDYPVIPPRCDRVDDARDDTAVRQEVLAEAFAGDVHL
jgi:hypothetical protein